MIISRRALVGSIPLLLARTGARAEGRSPTEGAEWPGRLIRFVVPAAPGSAGDAVCRLVAARLGDRLGQQLVIANQPAAGGTLAIGELSRATPDGYMIGQISESTRSSRNCTTPVCPMMGSKISR
jgi:tripartite-type tricarboxylate transporter receptor subunit TctC